MNINFNCTTSRIFLDVPHQIWEAQAADGYGTGILLVRILHNKILFLLNNFSNCYFSYFSPEFIASTFTFIGLLLFLAGVWYVLNNRKIILLSILILSPIFPLLEFPKSLVIRASLYYLGISIIIVCGLISLFLVLIKKKK